MLVIRSGGPVKDTATTSEPEAPTRKSFGSWHLRGPAIAPPSGGCSRITSPPPAGSRLPPSASRWTPMKRCRKRRSPPGPGSTPSRIPPRSAAGSCASSGARRSIAADRFGRGSIASRVVVRRSADGVSRADPAPDALLISRELEIAITQVVKALPRKLRDPFLLAASGDHRYEDIAAMLGVPIGTVKWRISEARRLIRMKLDRLGHGDPR